MRGRLVEVDIYSVAAVCCNAVHGTAHIDLLPEFSVHGGERSTPDADPSPYCIASLHSQTLL